MGQLNLDKVLSRPEYPAGLVVFLVLALTAPRMAVAAEPIPGVAGTGLTNQAYDPNWTVWGPGLIPGQAMVVTTQPQEWYFSFGFVQWIAPFADAAQEFPKGDYGYTLTFDLTGFDPSTARISGDALSDDGGALFLNGEPLNIPTKLFSDTLVPERFIISEGFIPGENTLEILVTNVLGERDGTLVGTPTGLIAQLSGEAKRDKTPPDVNFILLNPEEITTALIDPNNPSGGPRSPNDVIMRIRAFDLESGVSAFHLKLEDPNPDESADEDIVISETFTPEKWLRYRNVLSFDHTATEGLWRLSGTIFDGAGNKIDIVGGEEEIPEGVFVTSSACDASTVPWRVGPYPNASFGYSSKLFGTTYEFVPDAMEIRNIQSQMSSWQGWDDELRGSDYAIYLSYCEMKALKSWLSKGTYYQQAYADERNKIEFVINDVDTKIARLQTFRNQIRTQILLPQYRDLLNHYSRQDLDDIESEDPVWQDKKGKADTASFVLFLDSVRTYLVTAGRTAPPGALGWIGFVYDLYNLTVLVYDHQVYYWGDSELYDRLGDEFNELFGMYVELELLIYQYEKQLEEYQRILNRV